MLQNLFFMRIVSVCLKEQLSLIFIISWVNILPIVASFDPDRSFKELNFEFVGILWPFKHGWIIYDHRRFSFTWFRIRFLVDWFDHIWRFRITWFRLRFLIDWFVHIWRFIITQFRLRFLADWFDHIWRLIITWCMLRFLIDWFDHIWRFRITWFRLRFLIDWFVHIWRFIITQFRIGSLADWFDYIWRLAIILPIIVQGVLWIGEFKCFVNWKWRII